VASLSIGAAPISLDLLLSGDPTARAILFEIRLPRILLGALVGASLSLAGLASQALLGSPLADPFTLGISGGAALGAALAGLVGAGTIPGGLAGAALAGAAGASLLVYLAARRTGRLDIARLLLAGLVGNALFSALLLLALSVARADALRGMVFWMMGSLAGAENRTVLFLLPGAALGAFLLARAARPLDLLLAGDESAASLGVDVERVRRRVFLAVALLTASAVAAAGVIGFVGLLVPHAARRIVGSNHGASLAASALFGAAALLVADLLARTVVPPAEIPIGALSALVGAPLFLFLLLERRERP
jgi:iron complex transport system permease protein